MVVAEERLYRAPSNSVRPPGRDRSGYAGLGRLVVARLVWPGGAVAVPARLLWVDGDAVHIEWDSRGTLRQSWIPRHDVGFRLTLAPDARPQPSP